MENAQASRVAPARGCTKLLDRPESPAARLLLQGWLPRLLVMQHQQLQRKTAPEQQPPSEAVAKKLTGQESVEAWDHSAEQFSCN